MKALLTLVAAAVLAFPASAQVLFSDNFNDGDAAGWQEIDGQFSVVNGEYRIQSQAFCGDARAVNGNPAWTDYAVDLDFYIDSAASNRHAAILFRVQTVTSGCDSGQYYQLHIHPTSVGFCKIDNSGGFCQILATAPYNTTNLAWHHARLEVVGATATALIDAQQVLTFGGFTDYPSGRIGVKAINGNANVYDNIVVTALPSGPQCAATAFGPASQDPITISGAWTIGHNCTLDFGSRHVILGPGAALTVSHATMLAGKLTLQAGATIASTPTAPGSLTIATTPGGAADGSVQIAGTIDLTSDPSGGSVTINAGGPFSISGLGRVRACGNSSGSPGGTINVTAVGGVSLDGQSPSLDAHGNDAGGGVTAVHSQTGSVVVNKSIRADGLWQGGQVTVSAATTLSTFAEINANANEVYGPNPPSSAFGGTLVLSANTLVIQGDLRAAIMPDPSAGPCYSSTFGSGGSVSLQSAGDVTFNGIAEVQGGAGIGFASGIFMAVVGGNYSHVGGSVLAGNPFYLGNGGSITIQAGGAIDILASQDASGNICDDDGPGNKGDIQIHAASSVHLSGGLMNTGGGGYGWSPLNGLHVSSANGDVTMDGPTIDLHGQGPGSLDISAGRHIQLQASIFSSTYLQYGNGWTATISAGQDLVVSGTWSSWDQFPNVVTLSGCHITIASGAVINLDSYNGSGAGTLTATARDRIDIHGTVSAFSTANDGVITLKTRLDAPYSPQLLASSITPSPSIVHDPTLLPCLALTTTSLTGPSPLVPGATFAVHLASVPSRPIVVTANFYLQYVALGLYGWTQVDPFTAFVLADFGILGPTLPGSATDASGNWSFSVPSPNAPWLSGLTVYVDAYVIDPGAANGYFHQPPYLAVQFQ